MTPHAISEETKPRYNLDPPDVASQMIKLCAWFNIVVGILVVGLTLLAGLLCVLISASLGSSLAWNRELGEIFMVCAPLAVVGALYAFSGVFLRRSDTKVSAKAVLFQGLALTIAVSVSVGMWILNPQEHLLSKPADHLDFFVPAGFLLFATIQLAYLCVRWSKARRITNG